MLEAGLRRWNVRWDVVGLAELWLDGESEAGFKVVVVAIHRRRNEG